MVAVVVVVAAVKSPDVMSKGRKARGGKGEERIILHEFVSESGGPGGERRRWWRAGRWSNNNHDTTYDRGGDATGLGWDQRDRSNNAGGPSRRPSRG